MPEDLTERVLPASVHDAPNIDTYLASIDRDVIGSVTLTHHGTVTGVWSMATEPTRQRSGIGRRLLSTAMAEARSRGVTTFFLGATPAGQQLYESLGFTTRTVARVWASGETHQA
jgi:GNAT superfamily N-acetyltransferase